MTDDPFVSHRSLLFTVAYELLGSAADAEDTVQETWLRWDGIGADGQAEVIEPRAYLVRIVSRLALNRLRTLARRKEDYVGEWLPEPLVTDEGVRRADDADTLSMAFLLLLER
ncbi:MAG: sigma factor, partial [Jatrophihabitantaceae bacterium]